MGTLVLGIVALVSVLVAVAMTLVAWRVVQPDRRRSAARIAALAAEIATEPGVAVSAERPMFQNMRRPELSGSVTGAVAAGVLLAAAVALVVSLSGSEPHSRSAAPAHPGTTMAKAAGLELIALGHERENDRLVVRGRVRALPQSPELSQLTAVVLLFDQQGGFLRSARSDVAKDQLESGREAPFVVTIPGAADAARYRVSFRSDDRLIPHVDRRG